MILYLDTSALVKLYVEEENSSTVEHMVSKARIVATHLIAYVEAQAAFARLQREGVIRRLASLYENLVRVF